MSDINWHDVFEYRDGNLYWKIDVKYKTKKGEMAGSLHSTGYVTLRYRKKAFYAHRVIFEMFNGKIPKGMRIDHINNIESDNRIENLRLATRSQNMRNRRGAARDNKTSGARGVSASCNKWRAYTSLNGKQLHLGLFNTKEEAAEVARLKRVELYGEFAGD